MKNRAGEFSRATAQHVGLLKDFMVGEVDTGYPQVYGKGGTAHTTRAL